MENTKKAKYVWGQRTVGFGFERLFRFIEDTTGISEARIITHDRNRDVVLARALYIYIAKKDGQSFAGIGRRISRDHSSVIHLYRKYEKDPVFRQVYKDLRAVSKL